MRKKVLVLFLTLSMVLSFMPMIAFADTEAEGSVPADATVEEEAAEPEDVVQDNADEVVAEDEDEEEAVDEEADPDECKHENTYTYEDVDWENPKYEEDEDKEDNKYHKVIYARDEVVVCEDCDKELLRKDIEPLAEEDKHNYEDGVCVDCGHINTCTHDEMYTYTDWDREDEAVTYTKVDNMYHHVKGPGAKVTVCMLCGYEESRNPVQIDEDEEHDYEENEQGDLVCIYCKQPNTCKHEHKSTDEEWDWDNEEIEFKYTPIDTDNQCHKVKGPKVIRTICEDCGITVSEDIQIKEGDLLHNYDSNHKCEDCGHENSCKHEHTDYEYKWEKTKVEFDRNNNKFHKVTGPAVKHIRCDDCAETFEEPVNLKGEEFYHEYNSKGVCTECGHTNTCKHLSNPFFEYVYDDEECEIKEKDGSYHTVKGEISKYTYCSDCEMLLKKEDLGDATVDEIHYYNKDDVCIYCGYHKANIRIFGNSRYDTAIAAADKYKDASGKFENVIVASGENFPDALSGGYLAKVKNAPILLVKPSEEARLVDYISENIASGGKVYILGGTGSVSSEFESKVNAEEISTTRLGGATRFDTNLAILKAAGVTSEDLLICAGAGYADSLSASAVGKPILLVGTRLADAQEKYIKGLSTKQVYLIGGTGSVNSTVENNLRSLGFSNIERLWGATRYETSTAVAKKFFEKAATVILAYAQNFPDGLSGGPLAMLKSAPIVLTDTNTTTAAKGYVKSAGIVNSITLGGPALISDMAVQTIMGR